MNEPKKILHITVGSDDWYSTNVELEQVYNLFKNGILNAHNCVTQRGIEVKAIDNIEDIDEIVIRRKMKLP